MFTSKNREKLDPTVRDEFDNAAAESMQRFLKEHNHDGTHNVRPSGFDFVPIGGLVMWGSDTIPDGWLKCDGQQVSRTTYQGLFNVIGTTFGVGDGSTTFNVPNLVQRFPLGKAAAGTGSTLGATGGAIDHTHTGPAHTHTGPSHSHTIGSDGGHTHTVASHTHSIGTQAAHTHTFTTGAPSETVNVRDDVQTVTVASDDHTHSGTTASDGSHDHTGATGSASPATDSQGAHTHSGATGVDGTGATGSSGTGATSATNPPFLTVHFIILAGV